VAAAQMTAVSSPIGERKIRASNPSKCLGQLLVKAEKLTEEKLKKKRWVLKPTRACCWGRF
jgi:hypothetical protein